MKYLQIEIWVGDHPSVIHAFTQHINLQAQYYILVRLDHIGNIYDIKNIHNIGVRICHENLKILKKFTETIETIGYR